MDPKRKVGEYMTYRIVGELEGTEITFTSTHPDGEKREDIFETIEEAEDALNTLKMSND
uniref:hypothetical protein n=1 Tax=Bacillus subtilis TaxID=1423 RepID=UPI002797CC6D|nr:hypothetical protein P5665_22380 [Bacillus subtilis]WGD91505.1 hypothetical protein P5665_22320 [Bacillus subtilis]WGD91511.1 hypothetical protein P5665_22350 [Bacillus subtilis]